MSDYVAPALAGAGALGGWGAVRYLLNLRSERRKSRAEAELKELEAAEKEMGVMKVLVESLRQRIEQQDRKISELNARVDRLYEEKHQLEKANNELVRENNELRLKLMEARHNVCVRPDDECLKRMPPRDYCRLVKLAKGEYDAYYPNMDGNGDSEVPEKPCEGGHA